MGTQRPASIRFLPDGTPLHNRLLAALPAVDYERILKHLRLKTVVTGDPLLEHGTRITDVYFPNSGVFSITNQMRDGALVEVATVGREGMLGIGVFLGDRSGSGRTFQQVPNGPLPSLAAGRFRQGDRNARTVSRCRGFVRAGEPLADHAMHRVQCASRREASVLPLAAADA